MFSISLNGHDLREVASVTFCVPSFKLNQSLTIWVTYRYPNSFKEECRFMCLIGFKKIQTKIQPNSFIRISRDHGKNFELRHSRNLLFVY